MKQHGLDQDDVSEIKGSGKNGTILSKDLDELIKALKEEEEEEETEPESEDEE